jgi:hypothetical protein
MVNPPLSCIDSSPEGLRYLLRSLGFLSERENVRIKMTFYYGY